MRDDWLSEKIDVYSFGNLVYELLTGLWVFYENSDDEVVQDNVIVGKRAFIDDRYRHRSYIEGKLIELIEKCWIEDPRKRIDIFEAVRFLRTTLEENNKQGRRWIS
jgi:serine/threonine protein kinase